MNDNLHTLVLNVYTTLSPNLREMEEIESFRCTHKDSIILEVSAFVNMDTVKV